MIYGYARVSTTDQKLEAQRAALTAAGAQKHFAEKESGARARRILATYALDGGKKAVRASHSRLWSGVGQTPSYGKRPGCSPMANRTSIPASRFSVGN